MKKIRSFTLVTGNVHIFRFQGLQTLLSIEKQTGRIQIDHWKQVFIYSQRYWLYHVSNSWSLMLFSFTVPELQGEPVDICKSKCRVAFEKVWLSCPDYLKFHLSLKPLWSLRTPHYVWTHTMDYQAFICISSIISMHNSPFCLENGFQRKSVTWVISSFLMDTNFTFIF